MGEIATRGMIRAKISSFPSGNDSECLTKSEILATNTAVVNGSYGNTECPVIDDVIRKEIHPLQYEIEIKRGTTGIISLSGSISEILLVKLSMNGIELSQNRIITVGGTLLLIIVSCTFTGNAIEFEIPISAPTNADIRFVFSIDGREYAINVLTL